MLKFIRNPFVVIGAVLLLLANSSSHPTNNGGYTGAPGDGVCSQCHSGGSFTGEINIDGVPASITPGDDYQITVTVTNPNLNISEAGFQIVALNASNTNAGNFTSPSAGSSVKTSAAKKYFGHAPSIPFMGLGELTWTVTWTAPATGSGDITFYGGAILANGNNSSSNDKFVTTQASGTLTSSPTPLSVTLSNVENVTCNGEANGSATAVPAGGSPGYSYSWNNGETSATATALPAGLARVTVTDNAGATSTASVNITQPAPIDIIVSSTQSPSCFNTANGAITVSATGGVGGFFYDWSNGASGASISGLTPGIYEVTATDGNNCQRIEQVNLTGPPAIQVVSAFITNVTCFGGNNGTIDLTASGGTGTLDIAWSSGQTGGVISNLSAGVYTASITDDLGCQLEVDYTVTQPQPVGGTATVTTPISCQGGANGAATAVGSGGTNPYTYSWSTGANTAVASNLQAGTYNVTITDKNNCTAIRQVVVSNPPGMTITIPSVTNASCPGVANGAATLSVAGGTSPYTAVWSNGATGLAINNVTSGTYTCTVTDNKLCTQITSVVIGSNQQATLEADTFVMPTCFGLSNGSIGISATNAAGYTILWSNNANGTSLNQIPAGVYTAVASNSAGCISNTLTVTLPQPAIIAEDTSIVENISCAGKMDGSIAVAFTGGTGNLQYQWTNAETGVFIDSLSEGVYGLLITDANGCTASSTYLINDPDTIEVDSVLLSQPTCFGAATGSIILYASGGTGNLSFNWVQGLTGDTLLNVAAGVYACVIKDINNCQIIDTVTLNGPSPFAANDTITNTSVEGAQDGKITTSFAGGTAPYQYLWSTGDTTSNIDSLAAGLYLLTITDAANCTKEFQFNVQSGSCALSVSFTVQNVTCFGDSTGAVIFEITNGTPPFDISDPITGLAAGMYDFTVVDSNGCHFVVNDVFIGQPAPLIISVDTVINSTGPAVPNGSIQVTVSGGVAAYQFVWVNAAGDSLSNTEDLVSVLPGTYYLFIKDSNDCQLFSDSIVVDFTSASDDVSLQGVNIYPNPFNLRMEIDNLPEGGVIEVYDATGKRIQTAVYTGGYKKSIETGTWTSGMYLVRILSKQGAVRTFRLVK